MVSEKTVARLSLYRRILNMLRLEGVESVFSHDLAARASCTAAQVRRDVMAVGYMGSSARGYNVEGLGEKISEFLYHSDSQRVALVGVGNLGRALLAYSPQRNPRMPIMAAFDSDPAKVNRVIHGCRCYPVEQLDEIVKQEDIRIGIITTPASQAQEVARQLCQAGVVGLVNFAPIRLWVPAHVYVEDLDVSVSLEKVAYFAGQNNVQKEVPR